MDLREKVNLTMKVFQRVLASAGHESVFVAWTGGKDSTVTLYLWSRFLEEIGCNGKPAAISLDTGLKFPEIIRFRDKMTIERGVDLHVVRPGIDISGYPVAADKIACCRDLKVEPLKKAITRLRAGALITGIRNDEHPDRADRDEVEHRTGPDYLQVNPILHWTEMDVWSFIVQENLPYCSLYDQGYSSLGCMPCTSKATGHGERSGRAKEKEQSLDVLRSLGYF
jgi:phosphoadenosine phosphosulfate reductase